MPDLQVMDILLLSIIILGVVGGGLYFFNKWAYKKMGEQQAAIERTGQDVTIYVIDKGRERAEKANLPKIVKDQLPAYSKIFKLNLVKAKVGPQIVTLICDKKVFEALPLKKNARVTLAGLYISEMKGMKSDEQLKAEKKAKKEKEKAAKKAGK